MKKTLLLFLFAAHCYLTCLQHPSQIIDVPPLLPLAALRELRDLEREQYRDAIFFLSELSMQHNGQAIINEYNRDPYVRNLLTDILSSEPHRLHPLTQDPWERLRVFFALPGLSAEEQLAVLDQLTPLELIKLTRLSGIHQNIINTYRNNATELDLSALPLTPAVIREMSSFYPNIKKLLVHDQSSLFSRIGEAEAMALVTLFPHLEHITVHDIDLKKSSDGFVYLKLWAKEKPGRTFNFTLKNKRLEIPKFRRA